MKPTANDSADSSARRRRLQLHARPGPNTDALNGILLENEDPEPLKDHCRAVVEKFAPQCEYDHFLAQLSASNTWRARRFVLFEGSVLAAMVLDQAPQVNREYEFIDEHSRAAITFKNPDFIHTIRFLRDTETTCLRRAALLNREMRTPRTK